MVASNRCECARGGAFQRRVPPDRLWMLFRMPERGACLARADLAILGWLLMVMADGDDSEYPLRRPEDRARVVS